MIAKLTNLHLTVAFILAMLFSLAVAQGSVAAQGIGIYPTNLLFEDTARGGEYFRTVGVINSGEADTVFTLEGEGPIAEWISFVEASDRNNAIESVTVPGKAERQTLLRVTVPQDAANGEYQGTAQVVARPAAATQGGGASVGAGAAIDVSVNVTGDQKLEGSLVDSSVSDIEVGSPLRTRAVVSNLGNVRFTPEVTLEVLDTDGNVVMEEIFSAETIVFPSEMGQLNGEIDSTDHDLGEGEYVARISARAGNLDLGSRETSFSILPLGTLTRQGELRDMLLDVAPSPGDLGKLGIVFANTGQIDTLAKFVGEMYFQDRLVEALETEELLVPVQQQKTLELFFPVDEPGEYLIKGKVNYQGKETASKELTFTVAEEGAVSEAGAAEVSETELSTGSGLSDAAASGAGGVPESPSVWQRMSNTFQDGPLSSPLGIAVIALGAIVVLLLIIMLFGRREKRYH